MPQLLFTCLRCCYTHGQEAEAQHVVDAQSFELEDDRSQVTALHLGHGALRKLLEVFLCIKVTGLGKTNGGTRAEV